MRVARLASSVRNAFTPTLRGAFGAWHDVVSGGGLGEREQRLLKHVVQRMRLRQAADAFHSWREHAQQRRQRKRHLVLHIGNRVLSEAFNQWCALMAFLHVAIVLLLGVFVAILAIARPMLRPKAGVGRVRKRKQRSGL